MSKKTKEQATRDPQAILAEYGQVCAELGDLVYRRDSGIPKMVSETEARIAELMAKAEQLNLENAAAVAAQKETPSNG